MCAKVVSFASVSMISMKFPNCSNGVVFPFYHFTSLIIYTSLEKFPNLRTHHITLWFVDICVVRSVVLLL
jgi:hypothetical protein